MQALRYFLGGNLKKSVLAIVVLLVLIPAMFPLILKAYLAFVPGKMVGGVDGWLGFLGGYSGGFLAFISAYLIYRSDQKQKEKTTLLLRPSSLEATPTDASLIFTTLPVSEVESDLKGELHFKYRIFNATLKNVSENYASNVQLLLCLKSGKLEPWSYNKHVNRNIKYESIATLEANESRVFNIQISEDILATAEEFDFILKSRNMYGQEVVQKVRLHLHLEMKGYTFVHRT
ncbi:hypothetical protein A9262_09540 [Vibrio splendidus]|nr:hypothetical protein A9262_09540 [Vibrio splendidus]